MSFGTEVLGSKVLYSSLCDLCFWRIALKNSICASSSVSVGSDEQEPTFWLFFGLQIGTAFFGNSVEVVLFRHRWNCTPGVRPTGTNCVNHHFCAAVMQHLQEDVWCKHPKVQHTGDWFLCHRSVRAHSALSVKEFQDRLHIPALCTPRCVTLFLFPGLETKKIVSIIVMKEKMLTSIGASSIYQVAS